MEPCRRQVLPSLRWCGCWPIRSGGCWYTVTMQLHTEGTLRCHAAVTLVLGRPPGVGSGVPAMRLIKEESMPLVLDTADFLKKWPTVKDKAL